MRIVLAHLERVGFDAAPRVLGRDRQGRWVLTYIPGRTAQPPYARWPFADDLLSRVARLLRRYHDAVAGLVVPAGMAWRALPPAEFAGETAAHLDVSLANVVVSRDGVLSLIDFEEVAPAARVWDVARTVRHWVPLIDPQDFSGQQSEVSNRQPARLAIFADAYGLEDPERRRLIDAALANSDASYRRMQQMAALGHPGYAREWHGFAAARNRRSKAWILRSREALARALGV